MSDGLRSAWKWLEPKLFVLGFLCAAAFNLGLLGRATKFPDNTWWKKGHASLAVLIVLGVITALYGTWLAYYRRTTDKAKRRAEIGDDLEFLCRRAAADIDDECGNVRLSDLGIHIWTIQKRRLPNREAQLERAHTFVIRRRPQSPGPWLSGKGVIGRAWAENRRVDCDLEVELYPAWLATDPSTFDALPANERLGLTHAEVDATQHYKAILAFPLRSKGELRAILSVDCATPGQFDCLRAAVDSADFKDVLGTCEALLEQVRAT